jgi:hypothetical protein
MNGMERGERGKFNFTSQWSEEGKFAIFLLLFIERDKIVGNETDGCGT